MSRGRHAARPRITIGRRRSVGRPGEQESPIPFALRNSGEAARFGPDPQHLADLHREHPMERWDIRGLLTAIVVLLAVIVMLALW